MRQDRRGRDQAVSETKAFVRLSEWKPEMKLPRNTQGHLLLFIVGNSSVHNSLSEHLLNCINATAAVRWPLRQWYREGRQGEGQSMQLEGGQRRGSQNGSNKHLPKNTGNLQLASTSTIQFLETIL